MLIAASDVIQTGMLTISADMFASAPKTKLSISPLLSLDTSTWNLSSIVCYHKPTAILFTGDSNGVEV